MKNTLSKFKFVILLISLSMTISCAKSTKDMVNEQQDLIDSTPLPPATNQGPTPTPQAASLNSSVTCQIVILPSLIKVSTNTGSYSPLGHEFAKAKHCIGQLSSGERRDTVSDIVKFRDENIVVGITLSLGPSEQTHKSPTYTFQFSRPEGDQYIPFGEMYNHDVSFKNSSTFITSSIIKNSSDQYLLICQARSACDQ